MLGASVTSAQKLPLKLPFLQPEKLYLARKNDTIYEYTLMYLLIRFYVHH